jgi:hypothetical protein
MSDRPNFVWIFDINRRVYAPKELGRLYSSGPPIWREHWRKCAITGETKRSWITEWGRKIPKTGHDPRSVCFSEEEIDRMAWIVDNRHRLARYIESITDFDKMKQVAEIVGYQEKPEDK